MPPKPPTFEKMHKTIKEASNEMWELQPCEWKGKHAEYPCICKVDGPFDAQWASLRLGYGCKKCGRRNQLASVSNYTEEDDKYIKENHHLSAEEIAKELKRTPKGIAKRREKLPVPKKTRADSGQTKIQTTERKGREQREAFRGIVEDDLFDYPASPSIAEKERSVYYFTGKECERGHAGLRYTSNRNCVECCMEDSSRRIGSEERKAFMRDYQKRPHVAEKRREVTKKRYRGDDQFRMRRVIASRITTALRRAEANKSKATVEYIGTSYSEYREWLELRWEEGMSWDNFGNKELERYWEQGHIRPIKWFDLQDERQALIAFNWRNVDPQWSDYNREVWYKYDEEDEKAWVERMRSLGFNGNLFLRHTED